MKKMLVFSCFLILFMTPVFAAKNCFLAKENGVILKTEGDCDTTYSPCSTFKISLALMGFDNDILKDEMHPVWPFKKEYEAFLESWKDPQTPTSWMKNSCVWYSQVLTPKLGIKTFRDYVKKFNYGNQDLAGDKGKNNGLTNCWLSSSLEISPNEQAIFLEKLLANTLPVNTHAHQMTKNIIYIEELPEGWKLFGKTGSGFLLSPDKSQRTEIKHGWFIGWIEKDHKKIIFVQHIVDDKKETEHAGPRAKQQAKDKILKFIASSSF